MRTIARVVLAILVLMCGCEAPSAHRSITPPIDPADVLNEYLLALQRGDCLYARGLATPGFGDGHYCGDPVRLTRFRLLPPHADLGSEMVFAVTLWTLGGDETMPDGSHTWFFQLKRVANARWAVSDGGSGP